MPTTSSGRSALDACWSRGTGRVAADPLASAYLGAAEAAYEAMRVRAHEFGLTPAALPWPELGEKHQGLAIVSVGAAIGHLLNRVACDPPREVVQAHAARLHARDRPDGESWVPFQRRTPRSYEEWARQDLVALMNTLRGGGRAGG
jgi:hypothetical protein